MIKLLQLVLSRTRRPELTRQPVLVLHVPLLLCFFAHTQ
jgi:hypothetical protein